jgi:hypothetical protein
MTTGAAAGFAVDGGATVVVVVGAAVVVVGAAVVVSGAAVLVVAAAPCSDAFGAPEEQAEPATRAATTTNRVT